MSQRFRFHFRLVVLFVERDLISLWPGPNFIFKDINNQELFVSLLASGHCGLLKTSRVTRERVDLVVYNLFTSLISTSFHDLVNV